MTNHPNRNGSSKLDAAVRIILRDERSGYADADTQGRRNIRRNVTSFIQGAYGTDDEINASTATAGEIADWYRATAWSV